MQVIEEERGIAEDKARGTRSQSAHELQKGWFRLCRMLIKELLSLPKELTFVLSLFEYIQIVCLAFHSLVNVPTKSR